MLSLFDPTSYQEILSRLEQLQPDSARQWGTMDASQMLWHCQGPLKISLGELKPDKPNVFMRAMFSLFKSSLYNDKPWKPGLPTSKEFVATEAKDFESEKETLAKLIEGFHAKRDAGSLPPHPMFGDFTMPQWGQMQYKHLDHHFRQFGV
ncbi:DUF1569 domain-containing protein [Mangrovimonas futianensis]|uniref:DUF1569 domain-containing protein n=1 Tax=Mangrovimonas futianensis TaxID=2895523 RepID=UPI001E4379D4|nr:DUF1569 domain-containing protein [Mangrovimonas futianensis]MCF1420111.1 DUF1569 domain-containing protein [Mangrovimonas futianensis]